MQDFDYELPAAFIAQEPEEQRDASRLMVVRRPGAPTASTRPAGMAAVTTVAAEAPVSAAAFEHRVFADLPDLLRPDDLLVMNDTRVLAARVLARRATGGAVELLFVAPEAGNAAQWRALVRPAKRIRAGEELTVGNDRLRVVAELDGGARRVSFDPGVDVHAWLETHGRMPLPPYIRPDDGEARRGFDRERYQTVYAREPGAVAAPTAGLHFTPGLLDALHQRGIETAFLTLDVGPGTFRPVTAESVEEHVMDAESYRIPEVTADAVNRALREGRRVVAVGTTSVRALEHAAGGGGQGVSEGEPSSLVAIADRADIFIWPGYRFRVVGAMITNLHLPRSTPILLAAAMVGRERLLAAYAEAVDNEYRFYSYGDAMLLQ